jgi:hypothetical protein
LCAGERERERERERDRFFVEGSKKQKKNKKKKENKKNRGSDDAHDSKINVSASTPARSPKHEEIKRKKNH